MADESIWNRRRGTWVALLALSALTQLACNEAEDAQPQTAGDAQVQSYELVSQLPACTPSRTTEVYYVRSEDRFYYCDGQRHQVIDLSGQDGQSWLVATTEAPLEVCPTGGVLIQIGPDDNRDGDLDEPEIRSTTPVCNGAVGPAGPQGEPGEDGADSESCTLEDHGDGTGTITCPDGTSLTVVLAGDDDAPIANPDSGGVAEDASLTVSAPGVLSNDTDADGDPLTAVLVSGPAHGTLTLNSNGSFSYVPNINFNGTDSFTYKANDGALDSGVATVTLSVSPVNDFPFASPDSFGVAEDTILTVPGPGVLSNDSDVDGDTLAAVLVSGPSNGVLTFNVDGSFSYVPNPNFNGTDSFTYKASDGSLDSSTAAVTIDVVGADDPPFANPDAYSLIEDVPFIAPLPGVLGNDGDADSPSLTAVLVGGPANGTLTFNSDGSFSYVANPNFNGTDSFTYKASDGTEASNVATVTLDVLPVNDGPFASPDSFSVNEDTVLTVSVPGVLGNDVDLENNLLLVNLVSGPANGVLIMNSLGDFTYTPNPDFNGTDFFVYRASDGALQSAPATVTINVLPIAD